MRTTELEGFPMKCPATLLLSDPESNVVLKCDFKKYHPDFHWDRLMEVFWKEPEIGVLAESEVPHRRIDRLEMVA
jgi:hypothetical protein